MTFFLVIALSLIGLFTIYSATRPPFGGGDHPDFYLKQIVWFLISVTALFLVVAIDYVWLQRFSYLLYVLGILLLLSVFLAGKTSMGAQRWLSIGPVAFQPSEFFRVIFIIGFSSYLARFGKGSGYSLSLKETLIFGAVPLLLLLKQPDLGTAVLLISLFAVLLLARGLSRKIVVIALVIGLISIPF